MAVSVVALSRRVGGGRGLRMVGVLSALIGLGRLGGVLVIHVCGTGNGKREGRVVGDQTGGSWLFIYAHDDPASLYFRNPSGEPALGLRPDCPIRHAGHPARACPRHRGAMPQSSLVLPPLRPSSISSHSSLFSFFCSPLMVLQAVSSSVRPVPT